MTSAWSTPADIAATVRRRWDDGSLLRAHATGTPIEPLRIPLRGPKASEIGDRLIDVRAWIADLDAGRRNDRRYTLVRQPIGGRAIGRNELPTHAVISNLDQAWELLGVSATVTHFDRVLEEAEPEPVRTWVLAHPHRALDLRDDMQGLVAAYTWLDDHRGSDAYLREISAPGIDTKFAEKHRAVLAAMLAVPSTTTGFLSALGLRAKPDYIRIRPAASLGLPAPLTELSVRAGELAQLPITPTSALVIENEVTYLSVEVPDDGIVLWGKGFDVDHVGRMPWLAGVPVTYWGDIDTHGFAILDRLRAWLPQTRSVLMDRETLLEHRGRWSHEDRPTTAALQRLTSDEQDLYADLISGRWDTGVRLEQERVDWNWARTRSQDPS